MLNDGTASYGDGAPPWPAGPERLPSAPDSDLSLRLTDLGNAKRLVLRHGVEMRYCHPTRRWYCWDGARWREDDTGEAMRRAKDAANAIFLEASMEEDPERQRALGQHATRSQAAPRLAAMLELAASEPGIPVRPSEFDRDPLLLNTLEDTIDLRHGELRGHDPADLISKVAPVEFDADATAPLWAACLQRWLPDAAVRAYLQRLAGYALTGYAVEHVITIFHGLGANGKTVLLRTLLGLWGDYALTAATDLLIAHRRRGGASPEVAELAGRRLVAAIETDEGAPLAESRVKALTGGDTAKGRHLYQGYVEIEPTWTLVLGTNHLPKIRNQDLAMWRRIALVPFTVTIPEHERDRHLVERLAAERPGILNWALEGCHQWQRDGLRPPDAVRAATAAYRAESDPLGDWLSECCVVDPSAWATVDSLWESYAVHSGGRPDLNKTAFGRRLTEMGHELERPYVAGKRTRVRKGIGLLEGAS